MDIIKATKLATEQGKGIINAELNELFEYKKGV